MVSEDNQEYVCGVSSISSSEIMMNVSINGAAQEILIDSGSVSSLIREENFKRLRIAGFNGDIKHCPKKPFAYMVERKINFFGQPEAEISAGNIEVTLWSTGTWCPSHWAKSWSTGVINAMR